MIDLLVNYWFLTVLSVHLKHFLWKHLNFPDLIYFHVFILVLKTWFFYYATYYTLSKEKILRGSIKIGSFKKPIATPYHCRTDLDGKMSPHGDTQNWHILLLDRVYIKIYSFTFHFFLIFIVNQYYKMYKCLY